MGINQVRVGLSIGQKLSILGLEEIPGLISACSLTFRNSEVPRNHLITSEKFVTH